MSSEKKKDGIITGTSHVGNLQEALDAATAQVGHGQQWRLASIDGLVGGIVGNDVNVHIYTVVPSRSEPGGGGGGAQEEGPQVPTRAIGLVERLDGPSICNDGAEFRLITAAIGDTPRLRPTNPEAQEVLAKYAGTRQQVVVTGYRAGAGECQRIDVFAAAPEAVAEPV